MNLTQVCQAIKTTIRVAVKRVCSCEGDRLFFGLTAHRNPFNLADTILKNRLEGKNMYYKRYGTFCLVVILALFVVGCEQKHKQCIESTDELIWGEFENQTDCIMNLQSRIEKLEQRKPVTHR